MLLVSWGTFTVIFAFGLQRTPIGLGEILAGTTCKGGFCNGHYCTELVRVQDVINGDRNVVMPPSLILKEYFTELCKSESPNL